MVCDCFRNVIAAIGGPQPPVELKQQAPVPEDMAVVTKR